MRGTGFSREEAGVYAGLLSQFPPTLSASLVANECKAQLLM
jgi:hypothetical protein